MPDVTETTTFALKGFAGGLNSEYVEHLRDPADVDASDMDFGQEGAAIVRKGLDLLAAHDSWTGETPAKRLAAIFPYTPTGKKYLICVDLDGKVWRTGDGPASPLVACNIDDSGPVQINLGAPPVVPDGATLDDSFVLVCEDDYPYKWDGAATYWTKITDNTLDDAGTSTTWEFPVCSTVCSAFGRMWASGNDTYQSRLFWSGEVGTLKSGSANAAGPWNWPAANWVDINPEDGGEITKIVPFGQAIIVFKTNSTYAFVGVGDPASARLYPLHQGVGCTLPATAAAGTGRLFWASADGVYQYDGTGISRIDRKIRQAVSALTDDTYAMWASAFALDEKYHLLLPSTSLTSNTVAHYVYDSENQRWAYHTDGGFGSAVIVDQPYLTRWGGVYKMWGNDPFDDITSAAGATSVQTVPAYLKTAWMPPPEQRTGAQYRVRRIDLYLERPAVSGSYSCTYVARLFTNYNEGTKVVGYTLNLDTLEASAEGFVVPLPGYAGLCDSFQITVTAVPPGTDTGNERIAVNGIALLLSERRPKRSKMLASGVTAEA